MRSSLPRGDEAGEEWVGRAGEKVMSNTFPDRCARYVHSMLTSLTGRYYKTNVLILQGCLDSELFAPVKLAVGDTQGSPILLGGGSLLAIPFGIHEDLAGEDHVNLAGRGRIDVPLRFERPAQLLGDSVGLAFLGLKRHRRPGGGLISSGVGDLPRFCLGDAEQVQNAYIGQAFFEQKTGQHAGNIFVICTEGLPSNSVFTRH